MDHRGQQRGYHAVGIDPSLGAIVAARRTARQLGVADAVCRGDARHLPFAEADSTRSIPTACCSTCREPMHRGGW
jgi:hypothetical protein